MAILPSLRPALETAQLALVRYPFRSRWARGTHGSRRCEGATMIFRYLRYFRRTFFVEAATGRWAVKPTFRYSRYSRSALRLSESPMTFLTQVPSKSCRTVFGPFMTVFDGLFGADRPRNSRRIKHSSVFHPLAHRLKTVKTVKTAPHRIPTVPVSSLRSGRRGRFDQNSSCFSLLPI